MKLIHRKLGLLLFVVLLANIVFAQGEAGGSFLLISPGARAGGMGEAQVALANDAYASYWNPAGLAFSRGQEIAAMHMNWLPGLADDIYYEFLAYRMDLGDFGALGFHATYVSLGEIVHTGATGPEELSTFTSYMWNLGVSYARQIGPQLSLGVTVKYFQQYLAPARVLDQEDRDAVSGNIAFDIGVLRHGFGTDRISLGASVTNMGSAISFLDQQRADPAPTRFRTGMSIDILQRRNMSLVVAYDAGKVLAMRGASGRALPLYQALYKGWGGNEEGVFWDNVMHNVGAEAWLFNTLALRAGAFYQKAGHVYTGNGSPIPTVGAGLRLKGAGFDFGYVLADKNHPLANTMRFSLNLQF